MDTIIDGITYDWIPEPQIGDYKPTRKAPKTVFTSEGGYSHQRETWPRARKSYSLVNGYITTAQKDALEAFLDYVKSTAFYYLIPTSDPEDPTAIYVRVTSADIPMYPSARRSVLGDWLWHCEVTVEEV